MQCFGDRPLQLSVVHVKSVGALSAAAQFFTFLQLFDCITRISDLLIQLSDLSFHGIHSLSKFATSLIGCKWSLGEQYALHTYTFVHNLNIIL